MIHQRQSCQRLPCFLPTGQVLERLNGKSVSKAFSNKKFADIHYIRSMMLEVRLAAAWGHTSCCAQLISGINAE
jgi:hypothetical protein